MRVVAFLKPHFGYRDVLSAILWDASRNRGSGMKFHRVFPDVCWPCSAKIPRASCSLGIVSVARKARFDTANSSSERLILLGGFAIDFDQIR